MNATDEAWQQRIHDLYANIEELYSHVDVTVVAFDRDLVEVGPPGAALDERLAAHLTEIARDAMATGQSRRDVPLDQIGRHRVHAFAVRDGVLCVVIDDGARRELFVRCAMALFDGYRQNEAALLERERKALEEAQRANRQRDQFLATVAHELQGPMASILLWEHVLRDPTIDAVARKSAIDAIHESASGGSLVVSDLLDVSRAINGKLHIERRSTALARVLTLAIEDARQRASAGRVEIVAQLDPELGSVLGDSRRLRQVFTNLLSNALKHTDQGTVSIVARQDDQTITVEISDTGRGIDPAFLPHMFEPFTQADDREAAHGLGLGLTISRQLVALHDGTLSAASEGLGRGAQVTVTLPRAQVPRPGEPSERPSVRGVRVLVVDDDALFLEGLQVVLRAAGAIVTGAPSVAAACAILEQELVDIVLSDLAMPGEYGVSLVQKMRALGGAVRRTPAIAVTAHSGEDSRARALAAGFARYITKPVDVPLLIANIAELVRGVDPA